MMKKLLLLILALLPMVAGAQDIDETDLVGLWKQSESYGEFRTSKLDYGIQYYISRPDELKFYAENNNLGDDSLGVAYYIIPDYPERDPETWQLTGNTYEYCMYMGIQDYFISKNNILHIQLRGGHHCQRYRITEYDGNSITLQTLDNKGWIIMKREGTTSLAAIKEDKDVNEQYYNLEGKLIYEPQKGVNIANGKKYVKK